MTTKKNITTYLFCFSLVLCLVGLMLTVPYAALQGEIVKEKKNKSLTASIPMPKGLNQIGNGKNNNCLYV